MPNELKKGRKQTAALSACPVCGKVPRLHFSEELEIWWIYGNKECKYCEKNSPFLPDREGTIADWNRQVENDIPFLKEKGELYARDLT